MIKLSSSDVVFVPKMMPDTEFTEFFTGMTETVTETTKVSLVLSLSANLIMSGPVDLLWGLINSL